MSTSYGSAEPASSSAQNNVRQTDKFNGSKTWASSFSGTRDVDMLKASSTQIAKRFSQDRGAAQLEPIGVTHHGRVTEVLISKDDYDDYVRLKSLATRAFSLKDISDEAIAALEKTEMDPRHAHLDPLMGD